MAPFPDPPTTRRGWPNRAELLASYAAASGTLGRTDPLVPGFAAWRLALVFEGAAGRLAAGAYGPPDSAEERRLAEVCRAVVRHAGQLLAEDER